VHYGAADNQATARIAGDFTEWHNFAVDWAADQLMICACNRMSGH